MRRVQTIAIAAATAFIVSVACCRISASITFKIIDKYVADMVNMTKESIRNAYSGKGDHTEREVETLRKKVADLERNVQNQPKEIISQILQQLEKEMEETIQNAHY